MIRILFLIRSLEMGGAEKQLVELVKGFDKTKFNISVVSFYPGGILREELAGLHNVNLFSLEKKSRWDLVGFLFRFKNLVKDQNPDILHGYLDFSNLMCLIVGKLLKKKIVWGIRSSYVNYSVYSWTDKWIAKIAALVSRFADLIIVNSQAGRIHYEKQKFSAKKMTVIQNGIDIEKYNINPEKREAQRRKWNIPRDDILIGIVARLDRIKDHPLFIRMAKIVSEKLEQVKFVIVGDGDPQYKQEIVDLIEKSGLSSQVIWAGYAADATAVYNAMDVCCLTSVGEGFPNVLGEAMACGTEVVSTDVGDAALIIGKYGEIVETGDPEKYSQAVMSVIKLTDNERKETGINGRRWIVNNFSSKKMVEKTEKALLSLLSK